MQVADVVLGFLHLEKKSLDEVQALAARPKFDYLCWDLYTRVTQFLAEDKSRLELRNQTLKDIEEGHGDAAKMGEIVSTAINYCHLHTLDRLGIDYDLLTQESDILHLKFWDAAFEMLKQRGAVQLATSGKNAGCWVMQLPSDKEAAETPRQRPMRQPRRGEEPAEEPKPKSLCALTERSPTSAKISRCIFGNSACLRAIFIITTFTNILMGIRHGSQRASGDDPGAPTFGHAHEVFNVIDSRQAYPQQVVVAALRALGYSDEAGPSETFCLQRGGADASLRLRDGLRNSARGREARLYRSQRPQGTGRKSRRSARPARSQRAQGSGCAPPGFARKASAPRLRTPSPSGRCAISCYVHALDCDRV